MKHLYLSLDEREQQITGRAAWYSFCTLLGLFFGLIFYYNLTNQVMPWSTQLIGLSVIAITFVRVVKENGYHFRLPGILPENEVTLEQPAAIRALPWALMVIWAAGLLVNNLPTTIHLVSSGTITWSAGLFGFLAGGAFGFLITRAIARDIRLGNGTIIRLVFLLCLLGLLVTSFALVASLSAPGLLTELSLNTILAQSGAFAPLSFLWSVWYGVTLSLHRKTMIADAKWDAKKSPGTVAFWAAKGAKPYLITSTIACFVFNGLALAQQFSGLALSQVVFAISGLSSFASFMSLLFGLITAVYNRKKSQKSFITALLWGAGIIAVNILVAHFTPGANKITF